MGFFKLKQKIKVLYRNKWYYASDVGIDEDGNLDIEYCHDLSGCIDSEHIQEIILEKEPKEKKRTNGEIIQSINNLLGFTEYKDKIKWSNANKEEMLRLEKAIRNLKDRSKDE